MQKPDDAVRSPCLSGLFHSLSALRDVGSITCNQIFNKWAQRATPLRYWIVSPSGEPAPFVLHWDSGSSAEMTTWITQRKMTARTHSSHLARNASLMGQKCAATARNIYPHRTPRECVFLYGGLFCSLLLQKGRKMKGTMLPSCVWYPQVIRQVQNITI